MKAFGMKSLSLAVLGLVGFGMASSASAVCPYPFNVAAGGAWSAQITNAGTLAADSPGLELVNPSACKMKAFLNAAAGPLATAAVADTSPTNEQSYHFRFYIDTTSLGTNLPSLTSVQVFAANAAASFPLSGNGKTSALLRVGIAGTGAGSNPNLVVVASCNPGSNFICAGFKPLTPGKHWIEGHLTNSATAIANVWIDKASITNDTTPAPDIAVSFDNHDWGGVDTIALGLGGASFNFRQSFTGATNAVWFDNFDSRRQTFIGQ